MFWVLDDFTKREVEGNGVLRVLESQGDIVQNELSALPPMWSDTRVA